MKRLLQICDATRARFAPASVRTCRRRRASRAHAACRGVTLLELLIVMTLIALMVGIAYPSAAAGMESLRFRSTTNQISNLLSTAMDHAQRRQQVVEVWISPKDSVLIARSPDLGFVRRMEVPESFRITSILPPAAAADSGGARRFLMYPGGTIPAIGVEISNAAGAKRIVRINPLSGFPQTTEVKN